MAAFFTLLYVAPISEAENIAIDVNENANERWPNACLNHIGDEELAALWDVLEPEEEHVSLIGDLAYTSPDGDLMVMTVPSEFIEAVTELPEEKHEIIAMQWQTSDLMSHWQIEDIMLVLKDLSSICRESVSSDNPILQVSNL